MAMPFYENQKNRGYRTALAGVKLFVRILVLILIIIAVIYAAKKIYALGYEAFSAVPAAKTESEAKDVTVVVTRNMELADIYTLLSENGLIDESKEAFEVQARVYGYAKSIVPGPYVLNTSMTVEEILAAMSPSEEEDDE